jgi:hypothetical protein
LEVNVETQSAQRVEWLSAASLVIGVLAFLSGIPIFVLVTSLAITRNTPASTLDLLIEAYFDWVSMLDLAAVSCIAVVGFALGLFTLILNFIASNAAGGNSPGDITFTSYILGALGIAGNGIVIMFFMVMTIR